MANVVRIAGVEIPVEKQVKYSLQYIFGVGPTLSDKVLKFAKIEPTVRTKDLTDDEINKIRSYIEQNIKVEGDLRQEVYQNIKRLRDIRSYRGIRHKLGLPVRGQRTRTNAKTRKGKHIAVGGLKRKLEKT